MDTGWIQKEKQRLEGLFAAGDVAGGGPKKYVTGCFVEGETAAISVIEYIKGKENYIVSEEQKIQKSNK